MILASGCFDGLHSGHVRYLRLARAIDPTDRLMVAIAHDTYIGDTKERQSLWSQIDRGETVAAVRGVDEVILQGPGSVASVILDWHPTIVVKGDDWIDKLPVDVVAACETVGAQIRYVWAPGHHVEDVLARYVDREIARRAGVDGRRA